MVAYTKIGVQTVKSNHYETANPAEGDEGVVPAPVPCKDAARVQSCVDEDAG